jgi:N4-gp56 family major capsid protein
MKTYKFTMLLTLFDVTIGPGGLYQDNGNVVNAISVSANDLTVEQRMFYHMDLVEIHSANLVHEQFAMHRKVPQGSGPIFSMRGFDPYEPATTPLQEGVTPAKPNKMKPFQVVAEIKSYGAFTPHTDWLHMVAMDDVAQQDIKKLGIQSAQTKEILIRDTLSAGKYVMYAPVEAADGTLTYVSDRTSLTSKNKFSVREILRAVAFLKNHNAQPIEGSFMCIIHPDVELDVLTSKGFTELVKYTNNVERVYNGEIGKIGMVRFVVSSMAKKWEKAGASETSGKADVYSSLVLADSAYVVAEYEGGGLQTFLKPVGSAGSADPLNQRGTNGWKFTLAVARVVEEYMIRVESGASANPYYTTSA